MNFFAVLLIVTTLSFMNDVVESMKLRQAADSRSHSPLERSIFARLGPMATSSVSLEEKVMFLGRFKFEELGLDNGKNVALMTPYEMLKYIVEIGWKQFGLYRSLKASKLVPPGHAQSGKDEDLWNPWKFFEADFTKLDYDTTNKQMSRFWSRDLLKMIHELFSDELLTSNDIKHFESIPIERYPLSPINEITISLDEKIRQISHDLPYRAPGEIERIEMLNQLKSDFQYIRDLIDSDSKYGSVKKVINRLEGMYEKVSKGDMSRSLTEQITASELYLKGFTHPENSYLNDYEISAFNLKNAEENLKLAIGYLKKLAEIGGLKQVLASSQKKGHGQKHASKDVSNGNERLRFHFRNDLSGQFECISGNNHLNVVAKFVGIVEVKHLFFEKLKYSRLESKKNYKDNVSFGVFEIESSKEDQRSWMSVGVECTAKYKIGGYTVRIKDPFKPLHIVGDFVNHFVLTGNVRENEYGIRAKISASNGKIFEAIQLSQPAFNVYYLEVGHEYEYLEGRRVTLPSSYLKDYEGLGMTFNSQTGFPRMKLVIRNEKNPNYNSLISTLGITKFRITNKGLAYDSEGSMTLNPIVDAFCFETPQKVRGTESKTVVFNVDIKKSSIPYPNYDILIPNSNEDMSCVVLLQNEVCYLYESIFSSVAQDLNAIDHTIVGRILEEEGFRCKKYVIWIGEIEMKNSSITHVLEQLKKRPETVINKKEDHTNNAPNHPVIDFAHNGISASNVNKEAKAKVQEHVVKVPKEQKKMSGHKAENGRENSPTKNGVKWVMTNYGQYMRAN